MYDKNIDVFAFSKTVIIIYNNTLLITGKIIKIFYG